MDGGAVMGYQLRRWLADRLPASLSSGERLVALEIADLANEKTRLAYGSQLLDVLVHRTGLANQKQVGKVLGRLSANGVELRLPVRDKDGEVVRNKAGRPLYAFEGRKLSFRIPEVGEFTSREVPREGDLSEESTPAGGSTEGERSPAGETSEAERSPARGQEVPLQGDPVSSFSSNPSPLKPVNLRGDDADAAGSQQHDDQVAAAAAFLEELPDPWTLGPVTAKAMAPDLLNAANRQGWDFDGDLIARLTENPGGNIRSHSSILRIRIRDLPRRPAKPQPRRSTPLPPWCGECGDGNKAAAREGHIRQMFDDQGNARPCPKCHPSQTSHAA